ncbi:MAG: WecB/TagA/CpsF family glycosyltransferase [bacterium]|nr:WecB/TagA/CpsF family glycosyltransferase [bacterium]
MEKIDGSNTFWHLSFFGRGKNEVLATLENHLNTSSKLLKIFTPNPEQLVQASQDRDFSENLTQADILLPDGVGILWASRVLCSEPPIKERITGIDVASRLISLADDKRYAVLVIGGRDYQVRGEGEDTQVKCLVEGKEISIWWTPGYSAVKSPTPDEEAQVKKMIERKKPSIVLLAFGAPWQEKWIIDHQGLLEENDCKIAMAVGGTLDVLTGKSRRAPQVIRNFGLEWLYRLLTQPWRWKRQLRLPIFIWLVLKERVTRPHQG